MSKINGTDKFIGHRLRTIRNISNITQSELGQIIGVSHQQIQKYENARSRISASQLWDLSQALNTNINFFFQD